MKKYLLGLILGYGLSVNMAYSEQCGHDFRHFFITKGGDLALYLGSSGGSWWYPCNFGNEKNNVSPKACNAAYAALLTAKVVDKKMTFNWPGTCDEITNPTQSIGDRGFNWMGVYNL
jgi:hypothetical protein